MGEPLVFVRRNIAQSAGPIWPSPQGEVAPLNRGPWSLRPRQVTHAPGMRTRARDSPHGDVEDEIAGSDKVVIKTPEASLAQRDCVIDANERAGSTPRSKQPISEAVYRSRPTSADPCEARFMPVHDEPRPPA